MRRWALITSLTVLALTGAAAAATPPKIKRSVVQEVKFEFESARTVKVSCSRVSASAYKCSWMDLMPDPEYHDYHGRARVRVTRFGADATLLPGVHCHFCRSGPVPKRLR